MEVARNQNQTAPARGWQARIKHEAYGKVLASPLVVACAERGNDDRSAAALIGGFWSFVDVFPAIIRGTYASALAGSEGETVRSFQRRMAPILSETLSSMEDDERSHRALWLRAARSIGLSAEALYGWPVLPEVRRVSRELLDERDLGRLLLYFVGVEVVAEGVSRRLSTAPDFVAAMGPDGMSWFAAHLVAPGEVGAHEDLAYKLALAVRQAAGENTDEASINAEVQRCVDWFVAAGDACAREFVG